MKIRTLWDQITIYDDDMNIIKEIPERPPEPPPDKVRMINIVEYEDRLMGIDPNAKPDFFLDLENDERLKDVDEMPEFQEIKYFDKYDAVDLTFALILLSLLFIIGYLSYTP